MASKETKNNKNDGIYLSNHKSHELDMALISLRIGFEAYYSTYQSVKGHLRNFKIRPSRFRFSGLTEEEINNHTDEIHVLNLVKAYIETIFHFHHFIEVSIKEILRQEHELLAVTPRRKENQHVILHKLLKQEEVKAEESGSLYTIPASEAIERLIELIDKKRMPNYENMEFITKAKTTLSTINVYRDRLVHRGTFMLRYTELDKFIGGEVFPFIQKMQLLPIYKDSEFQWQPKKLHCKIDLIEEIINECKKPKYNIHKVAFLKEMGRAAFVNPLPVKDWNTAIQFVNTTQKDAEKRAEEDADVDVALDIQVCPVCGTKSLARYCDRPDPDDEEIVIYQVTCFCCTFSADDELNDVKIEGLDGEKLWQVN